MLYASQGFSQKGSGPTSNSLKFLVATDNHLGVKETDPIRKEDSFNAFENVLELAKKHEVDFLLLGGDLFDEISPSVETLVKTTNIFSKYIFGNRPIEFEFYSEKEPNYANINLNIEIPVFLIHGNHDYPFSNGISTIDIFEKSKMVTYFGKQMNADQIVVKPLLFLKGKVKLAVYGIGYIKDVKLHHAFTHNKVKFERPENNPEEFVNILVIHQNRFKGNVGGAPYKNCIHNKMLPDFMHLVIWGHEHESIPSLTPSTEGGFWIHQPGSTVETSLIADEAKPKHAGLYEVFPGDFKFEPIFLSYQRPLIYSEVTQTEIERESSTENISEETIHNYLVATAARLLKEHSVYLEQLPSSDPKKSLLPLMRLRLVLDANFSISFFKFEMMFQGQVANSGDVVKLKRRKLKAEQAIQENEHLKDKNFFKRLQNREEFGTIDRTAETSVRPKIEEEISKMEMRPSFLNPDTFLMRMKSFMEARRSSHMGEYFGHMVEKAKSISKKSITRRLNPGNAEFISDSISFCNDCKSLTESEAESFIEKQRRHLETSLQMLNNTKDLTWSVFKSVEASLQENPIPIPSSPGVDENINSIFLPESEELDSNQIDLSSHFESSQGRFSSKSLKTKEKEIIDLESEDGFPQTKKERPAKTTKRTKKSPVPKNPRPSKSPNVEEKKFSNYFL